MGGLGSDTPPGGVREELQRILQSSDFGASERNRRFLEYVVEETLAGRAGRIKAYSVATQVFGRDDGFDPQADPIVRIEASRLRRALERYYLTAGSDDPIRITIPKGSYVPAFEDAAPERIVDGGDAATRVSEGRADEAIAVPSPDRPEPLRRSRKALSAVAGILAPALVVAGWYGAQVVEPASETAARSGPAIFVAAFEEEGDTALLPDFGKGFTREIIVGLTRFNDLFVFGPETTFRYGAQVDSRRVASDLGVDFILTGGTTVSGNSFKVDALLIDAATGQYLWAERFDGMLGTSSILAARDEVAGRVARSLAQPYGVIFANQIQDTEGKPPATLSSYECVLRFYLYWKTYRRQEFPEVRTCLERAIVADPAYAEAFAALSLVHSDAYRFGFGEGAFAADPRHTALQLAERAVEIAPDSARAHHALSLALWLMNDVERSLEAARTGLALNPNDTELMAELGVRYVLRNEGQNGRTLLHQAFARNPGQPSGYRLGLSLDHYFSGRHEDALAEARKIDAPQVVYGHLVVALAAAELGLMDEARAAIGRMLAIDPRFGEHVLSELQTRNLHPQLIPVVIAGLRKAGLAVPDGAERGRS